MNGSDLLIEVRDLTFGYDAEPVLRNVNLAIRSGDFLAMIGPNGGGKTTLVKLILGLLKPWSGKVIFHRPLGHGALGYVPQFSTFDMKFPLRVRDVVVMGRLGRCGLLQRYGGADWLAVEAILERLRLADLKNAVIGELSGGQRQRVLIARALVSEPAILFMDEPTSSVDAETRATLDELLRDLSERIPMVVITHDVTAFAPLVRQFACVNRKVYYHDQRELTPRMLEEAYGCPVELIAHGTPHRVLHQH
jgi:zinc transport system ATP-binding protein